MADRSRQRLRPWLVAQIDSGSIDGLVWCNRQRTIFQIPWKHGGKHDWAPEHSQIFKEWAKHTGKYREGIDKPDWATWKTRLRCAFNRAEFIVYRKKLSNLQGPTPFRVYEFRTHGRAADGDKLPVSKNTHSQPGKRAFGNDVQCGPDVLEKYNPPLKSESSVTVKKDPVLITQMDQSSNKSTAGTLSSGDFKLDDFDQDTIDLGMGPLAAEAVEVRFTDNDIVMADNLFMITQDSPTPGLTAFSDTMAPVTMMSETSVLASPPISENSLLASPTTRGTSDGALLASPTAGFFNMSRPIPAMCEGSPLASPTTPTMSEGPLLASPTISEDLLLASSYTPAMPDGALLASPTPDISEGFFIASPQTPTMSERSLLASPTISESSLTSEASYSVFTPVMEDLQRYIDVSDGISVQFSQHETLDATTIKTESATQYTMLKAPLASDTGTTSPEDVKNEWSFSHAPLKAMATRSAGLPQSLQGHELHVRVQYMQCIVGETWMVTKSGCRLYYGSDAHIRSRTPENVAKKLFGPKSAFQLHLPSCNSLVLGRKQLELTEFLLKCMRRGVVIEADSGDIYATRLCKCVVNYCSAQNPAGSKLQRNERTKIFDYHNYFLPALGAQLEEGAPQPSPEIFLSFGQQYQYTEPIKKVLISSTILSAIAYKNLTQRVTDKSDLEMPSSD